MIRNFNCPWQPKGQASTQGTWGWRSLAIYSQWIQVSHGLSYTLDNKCYFFRHTLSTHSKGNGPPCTIATTWLQSHPRTARPLLPVPFSSQEQSLTFNYLFSPVLKELWRYTKEKKNKTKSYTTNEAVWVRPRHGLLMQPRLVSNSVLPQVSDHWDYRCEEPCPAFPSLPLPPIQALVDRGKRQRSAEKCTRFWGP